MNKLKTNNAGVLAVGANKDQSGGQFLLLRPVIMRGGLECGHRVSPHGRTVSFVSWR